MCIVPGSNRFLPPLGEELHREKVTISDAEAPACFTAPMANTVVNIALAPDRLDCDVSGDREFGDQCLETGQQPWHRPARLVLAID